MGGFSELLPRPKGIPIKLTSSNRREERHETTQELVKHKTRPKLEQEAILKFLRNPKESRKPKRDETLPGKNEAPSSSVDMNE